jgi:hypothetical protein
MTGGIPFHDRHGRLEDRLCAMKASSAVTVEPSASLTSEPYSPNQVGPVMAAYRQTE